MWYTKPDDAIDQAKFRSRSHDAIRFTTTLATRSRCTSNTAIFKELWRPVLIDVQLIAG
jgi:hypothetical protein